MVNFVFGLLIGVSAMSAYLFNIINGLNTELKATRARNEKLEYLLGEEEERTNNLMNHIKKLKAEIEMYKHAKRF